MSGLVINPYLVVPAVPAYVHNTNGYSWCGTYTGTGATKAITGLGFQPDVILIDRQSSTDIAKIYTAALTAGNYQAVNNVAASVDANSLTSFDADGFTLGSGTASNASGGTYQFIAFKYINAFSKNISYTGTGATQTVAHSLGATPTFIAVKDGASAVHWGVYHRSVGNTAALTLATAGATSSVNYWNNTSPDGTNITVKSDATTNANTKTYKGFTIADVSGKVFTGTYTGDGTGPKSITGVGFQPAGILYWTSAIIQPKMSMSPTKAAYANCDADNLVSNNTTSNAFTMDSDGFTTVVNANATTYYYIAFAA